MRAYPAQTSGYVSAFEIGRSSYSWTDFEIEDKDDLIIYELLLRDFTENGGKEGNLKNAMEKLDYLETLGVNVIELMPVQEFDGNDSWGYNPNHYFAMDKAYGTREMYKQFIDECHKRGIAVFIDVVYNHLTGNNAFDKMYSLNINPFFNEVAPHPYSVFEDINHENEVIVNYIKRSLGYLLTEYNVDGFRFDLTKGFTNNQSNESTASNYDADRIAILKGYNDYIRSIDPKAVVILEHFCSDSEEKELAEAGMKVWRNINHAYGQAAQGTRSNSGFGGLWTGNSIKFGAYVGFMESHDEERNAYRQKTYGEAGVKGNLEMMMRRQELNAAFFLTVPGPKMIWQFGELGYDISIEEGGRTGRKAPKWEYLDVPERKALYDTYCNLIKFRRDNPEFFDQTASFSWKVGSNDWENGRFITCTAGNKSFVVVGNFTTQEKTLTVEMPSDGTWTNHFDKSEVYTGGSLSITLPAGDFRLLTNF
jgi:1,4-alpha-glucan branching enzyme